MEPHPYRQAFEAQDLDRLLSLLADEVIYHSPLIAEPGFEGRDSVAAIMAVALDLFKETEWTHDLGDEHSHVLVGNARVLDKPVKTTWLLESDAEGKIRDFWLMVRPLPGVIAIALAVGQAAERAEQGPELRERSEPLVGLAAELEPAAARVVEDLNRSSANRSTD